MKVSFLKVLFFCVLALTVLFKASPVFSFNQQQKNADTSIIQNDTIADPEIEEVIKSTAPPKKEKVEYVSQVTKYGFKNLFKNYTYNPTVPYSAQVNPYAESYMQDYLKAHGKFLQHLKATSTSYFNFIDGILSQYGLPKELKYLAVIESDLKSNALSIAGARGPWQFMSYTAKDYGLQVNQYVDDRTDYFKSTNAAAKYLLTLYKDLKDWLLVIAAYNGGPGRVYSAISKSGSRNFWDLQYYLPEESRNHVKKFIATHYIMETGNAGNNLAGTNFDYSNLKEGSSLLSPDITAEEDSTSGELTVSGRYKAAIIAKNLEMDLRDFNRYNPGFDNMLANGASYDLKLP
ncbi:MAG: lytic transglycosylase domain-containing protein, partial [Bacteroidota bacterium]|nr:lytic transglycosylase domain-containing protein [Bacteroidota bacterium]